MFPSVLSGAERFHTQRKKPVNRPAAAGLVRRLEQRSQTEKSDGSVRVRGGGRERERGERPPNGPVLCSLTGWPRVGSRAVMDGYRGANCS